MQRLAKAAGLEPHATSTLEAVIVRTLIVALERPEVRAALREALGAVNSKPAVPARVRP